MGQPLRGHLYPSKINVTYNGYSVLNRRLIVF